MGNDTENLVGEMDLVGFTGIVLSPINRKPQDLRGDVVKFREKASFDIVLDPQLYVPSSDRGELQLHDYFPDDMDTADPFSEEWWANIVDRLASCARDYGVDAVASPAVIPNSWTDDYFSLGVEVSKRLTRSLAGSGIRTLITVLPNFDGLGDDNATPQRIASIISEAEADGYYLSLVSATKPRREQANAKDLLGSMSLVAELEGTGRPVLVSYCSSDMLLYKAAGASNCASGKFFNLRRFTRSRYDEPSKGGRQLPYWFEHSFLAFLRGEDVQRLQSEGFGELIGTLYSDNYWSRLILEQWASTPKKAWVGLAWRQYLSWFWKTEGELSAGDARELAKNWLKSAEDNWRAIKEKGVLLGEMLNEGEWIRPWRQALNDFNKRI
jgi:hypothetical protein